MSNRQELVASVIERLEGIVAGQAAPSGDTFETDAGQTLFVGELPALGEDDPAVALALLIGEDEARYQGEQLLLRLPLLIHSLARADLEAPWLAVEGVLSDIKRAIEAPDRTLMKRVRHQIERGATRSLEREPGSTSVGAVIEYVATYTEVWGKP